MNPQPDALKGTVFKTPHIQLDHAGSCTMSAFRTSINNGKHLSCLGLFSVVVIKFLQLRALSCKEDCLDDTFES